MNYFADLEPFANRDHNQELHKVVSKLRLEKRLRDNLKLRTGRLIFERLMPLPR